jgi:hypothetical protein
MRFLMLSLLSIISCTAHLSHASVSPCGQVLGVDARPHLLNRRWRTVPNPKSLESPYEWQLSSRSSVPDSTFTLKVWMANGAEITRNARCPLFLDNYISLESPNWDGLDEIFRDNTIYYMNDTTCVLQNTWYTGAIQSIEHGPYFLDYDFPLLRCVSVDK